MEQQDLELIAANLGHDEELKSLWEEHVGFEKLLERYSAKPCFPLLKIWK